MALLSASVAWAGDVQWWSDVEFVVLQVGRVEWGAELGLRLRNGIDELYDRRAGTFVAVDLGKGIVASGGYMIRNNKVGGASFDWNTRVTGQVDYALHRFGATELSGATAYERQMGRSNTPDYNRYRQRFELERGNTGFSPWVYQDLTFLRQGFYRTRSRLGVQWRSRSGYSLGVAYQFEAIQAPGTSVTLRRHAIHTTISFEKPLWEVPR